MKLNNVSKMLLTTIAFLIIFMFGYCLGLTKGNEHGKQYVLDKQIIFDEGGSAGYYYSVLDDEKYNYCYESGEYIDPRMKIKFK